ncbi:Mov34/MPN/PAD-1 family protein [Sphingomonas sp. ID0503]|uniref:Mov34/MPN/PAD-1 family protein n=1 Tax=Sphingomonas sp. ID0503 TaxID=3399691 RepID=UPI003AFA76B1
MAQTKISSRLLAELTALAEADVSVEVCGLLFGREGAIEGFKVTANVADDPSDSFEIDPAALIAAHRNARTGGPQVVGCFHSHPSGSTTPSSRDAAAADPAGGLWLILAGSEAALWRARANGFDPVGLIQIA